MNENGPIKAIALLPPAVSDVSIHVARACELSYISNPVQPGLTRYGEMPEWSNGLAWKASVP